MTAKNDVTGDSIKTKGANSDAYRNNLIWDKSVEDAEYRLKQIKEHAQVDGQIFQTIDA